uniref:CASP-like protein n=1 Tax=Solanum tuberosum TaxID=4113 RepID=M1CL53_SOLTU
MKELFGGPGKVSGLVLRMGQCLFAAASMVVMASSHGFATCTAFCNGAASNMELLTCLLGYSCLKIEKRSKELRLFELACNR